MAPPVWALSVDLQTKTATFTSGLADAAKGARGSFSEIKSGAQEMSRDVSYSTGEARHGVMLLGEEFGIHLPRGLTTFIASLGPVGAAMEMAFPFLAIIVGATLLLEHLSKIREEGAKLTESQVNFGTTVNNVLNSLDEKLLTAGIRADELGHNHLGALNKQLELIDHQSMSELVQAFGVVSKAADATFAQLKTSWYQWGEGSAGAKSALDKFRDQYDSLLSQGKDKEANDLLAGTRESAEKVLALQKQAHDNQFQTGQKNQHTDPAKFEAAKIALQAESIGFTKKEVEAQETLVEALQAQANVQAKVNELKAAQKDNAKDTTQKSVDADSDKMAKAEAEAIRKDEEEKEQLREKAYNLAVAQIQENERLKIDATVKGSQERLSAISAAIQDENSKGLQETAFYRELLNSRTALVTQMGEQEKKLKAEAGKEAADNEEKLDELALADHRNHSALMLSSMRNSEQARMQDDIKFANEDLAIKMSAAAHEIAALDKSGNDYTNKLKALQDKQLQLIRAHENQITQIKEKAEEERNARILSAEHRAGDDISKSLTSVLMRHESFAKMMVGFGDQVVEGLMQNAIQSIITNNMTKESDAAAAARKAFLAGMHFPFPANIVMGPALGAMAFASVMAFESGGVVPGVGHGDTVPAMLEPGEGILNNKIMDKLSYGSKFGNDKSNSGGETHVHIHSSPTIHALDAEGMSRVLDKHSDTLARHFNNHLRRQNR